MPYNSLICKDIKCEHCIGEAEAQSGISYTRYYVCKYLSRFTKGLKAGQDYSGNEQGEVCVGGLYSYGLYFDNLHFILIECHGKNPEIFDKCPNWNKLQTYVKLKEIT